MRPPVHVASARQHSGEPSSGLGPNGGRNDRLRGPDLAGLDGEIAGLVDRSTQELRRAWRAGLTPEQFYDPRKVAILPMGFCYPGKAVSTGQRCRDSCRVAPPQETIRSKFALDSLLEEEGFEPSVPLVSRGDLPAPVHRHSFRPLRCLRSLEPFVHQREN
jgi:hypothetical protein